MWTTVVLGYLICNVICDSNHQTEFLCNYRPHSKDGEGNSFSFFVSSHPGGGVPTLVGGYLPWPGGTYLDWEGVPTLSGGTYLGQESIWGTC